MAYKFGVILVSLCIITAGIKKRAVSNIKSKNGLLFLKLLQHIKNEISSKRTSLYCSLLNFDQSAYKKTPFYQHVKQNGLANTDVFFEKNGDMLFHKGVSYILADFFDEIEKSKNAFQSAIICDSYISKLEKNISESKAFFETKTKLESSLCFLGAAALFVVLI